MHLTSLCTCLLVFSLPLLTLACGGHFNLEARDLEARQNGEPSPITFGTDGPADPPALGYNLNHFALVVTNLTRSMHFYGKILGMRHIFTLQATPHATVTYMSFSHGGKNGTGFQTSEELYKEKNNAQGQLELLCYSGAGPEDGYTLTPSTRRTNTFGHVGLIVPDIRKAQRRFERFGVKILKPVGTENIPVGSELANALGVPKEAIDGDKEMDALEVGLRPAVFRDLLFLEDPDGNMVEVVDQNAF